MVSEKAVEAAGRAWVERAASDFNWPLSYTGSPEFNARMRAALSAALPLLLDEIAREATYIVEQTELTMTGQTSRLNTIKAAAERIITYGKG